MIYGDNWDKITASVPHTEEDIEQRWAYINSDDYEEPKYVFQEVCFFLSDFFLRCFFINLFFFGRICFQNDIF